MVDNNQRTCKSIFDIMKIAISIITIKQTGEISISNNSFSKVVILGALDFSTQTQFFWLSNEAVSIPYVILGTDYSLIDKEDEIK